MTFYLIGLGLNEKSLSLEALDVLKKSKEIYLENYTVEFPYEKEELEKTIGKKISELGREQVEGEDFLDKGKKEDIALLVYGSPLVATTHVSLLLKCKKDKIKYKIFQNASIFDAVAETGLQIYKFGKTASMPSWTENYKPKSFVEIIKDNKKIKAHTLILVDIGLDSKQALNQLKESYKADKLIVCSKLGTDNKKIFYDKIENLMKKKIQEPISIIIPGNLHFKEKEMLK